MNFRVVHLVLQLSYPGGNPCGTHSDENGRCLYLCLLSAVDQKGYICACPTGTVLHSNQRDCEHLIVYGLFPQSLGISEVIDTVLPMANLTGAVAIDLDPVTAIIYWTDVFSNKISCAKTDDSHQITLVDINLNGPLGIAVDWLARKLY